MHIKNILHLLVLLVVIAVVILGVASLDSPEVTRQKKADQNTISTLSNIYDQIQWYWRDKEELPESIQELKNNIRGNRLGWENIEYIIGEETPEGVKFELCAHFERSSEPGDGAYNDYNYLPYLDQFNTHQSGRQCFELSTSEFENPKVL